MIMPVFASLAALQPVLIVMRDSGNDHPVLLHRSTADAAWQQRRHLRA
jgi:hypothetical protein